MQELITIINDLQDVFNTAGIKEIDLPQIVVVGAQSSGKSSVLENIVGKDFLPRGSGIVTRRPLILNLKNIKGSNEWGEFAHKPGKKFTDFKEIRKEIEDETDRLCPGKTISKNAISLKVYSPDVIDLTLVDLPGIVKVSVDGQSDSLVEDLYSMVKEYCDKPNSIILAVSAANVDLANSDALNIAKRVDPNGDRTICVLTKLDIMDQGTDAMDVLNGKVYKLKLGYTAIVNRSQRDINNNVSIKDALNKERRWFENHPVYGQYADRLGTRYLTKRLNEILTAHIREKLPKLQMDIYNLKEKAQKEYDEIKLDDESPDSTILRIIHDFTKEFSDRLSGKSIDSTKIDNVIKDGAKIAFVFKDIFKKTIDALDVLSGINDVDILTAIKNASGTKASLFIPQNAFELLVKKQIKSFESPSHQCVDDVYKELLVIVRDSAKTTVKKYSNLQNVLIENSIQVINGYLKQTHGMVSDILHIESSYINTNHPDFDSTKLIKENDDFMNAELEKQKNQQAQKRQQPQTTPQPKQVQKQQPQHQQRTSFFDMYQSGAPSQPTPQPKQPVQQPKVDEEKIEIIVDQNNLREKRNIRLIRKLCEAYLLIVRKTVNDLIPKTIMHFLVNKIENNLLKELINKTYNKQNHEELLAENPQIVQRRKELKTSLDAYSKAIDIISKYKNSYY